MADGILVIAEYGKGKVAWPLAFWLYRTIDVAGDLHGWRYVHIRNKSVTDLLMEAARLCTDTVSHFLAKRRAEEAACSYPYNTFEVLTVEDALAIVAAWKLSQAMSQ